MIRGRRSKDNKINKKGRRLLEAMEGTGWGILNETIERNEGGEYTYTGAKGNTVIDYVLGETIGREKIRRLEVGEEVVSYHHPLIIEVRGGERTREEKGRGEKEKKKI